LHLQRLERACDAAASAVDTDGSRLSKRKQASDEADAAAAADHPRDDGPPQSKPKHAPTATPLPAPAKPAPLPIALKHVGLVGGVQPRSVTLEAWQIDARLWPGAAVAGWSITINKADDSKIYSSPDGCAFKARCLAVAHKEGPRQMQAAKPAAPGAGFPLPRAAPGPSAAASLESDGTLGTHATQQPASSGSHAWAPSPASRKRGAPSAGSLLVRKAARPASALGACSSFASAVVAPAATEPEVSPATRMSSPAHTFSGDSTRYTQPQSRSGSELHLPALLTD
jgi:hypothetical protein